jgi:hypothetical protein
MKKVGRLLEYLIAEAPIAHRGDFSGEKTTLGSISKTVIQKYYKELKLYTIQDTPYDNIKLYAFEDGNKFTLGEFAGDSFVIYTELYTSSYRDIEKFGYTNIIQSSEIFTLKTERGRGYGASLYYSLVMNGYTIISDWNQFDGARNLWKKLQNYVVLDVYNELDDIIKTNHSIINTDWNILDKEWSRDTEISQNEFLFIAHK